MSTLIHQTRVEREAREAELKELLTEDEVLESEGNGIIAEAEKEGRSGFDAKEQARFDKVRERRAEIKERIPQVKEDIAELTKRYDELAEWAEIRTNAEKSRQEWSSQRGDTEPESRARISVTREPRTYTRDAEVQGVSFYRDLYNRRFNNDHKAAERLERHDREARLNEASMYEKRDGTTANYAGLTVPQYLTDMAAPLARAMRPTVDICNRHPLPADGMTVNISRITTGATAANQSNQGDGVSETDIDDTLLTVNVKTIAGQQDLSRQALERGTGVDSIVTQDLLNAYWTTVDNNIINGAETGAGGNAYVGLANTSNIETVTYADSSPTAAELYPKLANLISEVQSGVFMGVTHFIMHPRRWWWLASQVGSTFPLLQAPLAAPQQAGNVGGTEYLAQNRNILGVPVIVDGNVTTTVGSDANEDRIYAVTAPELHLWHDDGPMFIRATEPDAGSLEVKFVLYSYSAFTAGRYPGAHGVISSTGLVAPTF
jgi:HK97 family phage major capsid protein